MGIEGRGWVGALRRPQSLRVVVCPLHATAEGEHLTTTIIPSRGRLCCWYDDDGNIIAVTCDAWDQDHELVTTMVADIGPFDDVRKVLDQMRRALTAQQVLF